MVSCIVVEDAKVLAKDSVDLFKTLFYDDHFEMNEGGNGRVLIYMYKVEKIKVWQAVLNLEVERIPVGFGFGKDKEVAKKKALDRLKLVSEMSIH